MTVKSVRSGRIGGLILMCALAVSTVASAQTLNTVVSFNGSDGSLPAAGLIADAGGNLYGTTNGGGASGDGTVFEIAKTSSGYATTPTTLVSFTGSDGGFRVGGLIADAGGNLFGTTSDGGASSYGTVFEIAKTSSGYASTPTILVNFDGTNGANPYAGLIVDAGGNIFGTTSDGGASSYGTVFEVAKTSSGYASTPITLVNFNYTDGANPDGGLIADVGGNLYGTTNGGGASGNGTVFEVAKTSSGYASTPITLVSFNVTNGAYPYAGLIADAGGNLFGTTSEGGASGNGAVFEVAKTSSGYASTPTTLVSFNRSDGANPYAGLIADAGGNLFGTTIGGGASGLGTVFEVTNTSSGYASTPLTLVSFNGSDGEQPQASLIAAAGGNLFGTTAIGGAFNDGTVFEVANSGFLPPQQFVGTPGTPSCQGASISNMAQAYGGLAHAASSLGYSSVQALQNAVAQYCSQ
jgi:uncharacterized repeat protein (TIGR03803 family)